MARNCTEWRDPDEVWQYVMACHVGELGGPVFPVTQEEQVYWEARDQEAREWVAQHQAQRENDHLDAVPVVEYTI